MMSIMNKTSDQLLNSDGPTGNKSSDGETLAKIFWVAEKSKRDLQQILFSNK
jgi:hypothetical protein